MNLASTTLPAGNLYIIRGLPGTGKTDLANLLAAGFAQATPRASTAIIDTSDRIHEASDALIYEAKFDMDSPVRDLLTPQEVRGIHYDALDETARHMKNKVSAIVVVGVFAQVKHMNAYYTLCAQHDYSISVLSAHTIHGNPRNIPISSLRRLRDSFEYPTPILPSATG